MILEQIYTGCLAQGAYYIESNGEALVIDPLRETKEYIDKAKKNKAKIKYVLETHFHADFVSGHVDLASKTGASIVFGPNASPTFSAHIAKDGEELILGDLRIKVLHTPGHTMESTTYLLFDENGKEHAIFTGDTLFIGDVGRPDLAAKSDLTKEDLASHLFDSLREKVMTLPDDVIVYPAHGAGSACGKNMSKETWDSLGNQKKNNYALRADMNREEFIKEVTNGLLPPPPYFPLNVGMNKTGYDSFDTVMKRGLVGLNPAEFEAAANATSALILDTRDPNEFAKGFIPNSIFIGIDGAFAPWVGTLIPDIKQEILIIAEEGREKEVITRLSRVGHDNTIGFLKGGFQSWKNAQFEIDSIENISAIRFEKLFNEGGLKVVDVRKETEYAIGHLENAQLLPLNSLNQEIASFPMGGVKTFIHCAGGYRSVIAASMLKSRGYTGLVNVEGGFSEIKKTGLKIQLSAGATTCSNS